MFHFSPWADTFFLAPLGEQNIIWVFRNLRLPLKKYDGLSKSVAFAQNWGILELFV